MALGLKTRRRARRRAATATWHLDGDDAPSLYGWVAWHMSKGAAIAALVVFGTIAFILLIRAVSYLLPEDPYAALETGRGIVTALV